MGSFVEEQKVVNTQANQRIDRKHSKEAMDFLNYVAKIFKAWDEPNLREAERVRPAANQRGGMYSLPEDIEMKAKLST